MKWYFAVNEATLTHFDHDLPGLMLAAVASARANTSLRPHLLYDGRDNHTIARLRALGVTIVEHKISYYEQLDKSRSPDYNMLIAAGAFLRSEIPKLEHEDKFILYTDCDVIFRNNPSFLDREPEYFASAPEIRPDDYEDLNTGVMLMNLSALRGDLGKFLHFIVNNFETFVSYDQCAYKRYYAGRYDLLPASANWKPYWGWSDKAEIVHFHGPKPIAVRKVIADPDYPIAAAWRPYFERDPVAYGQFLAEWEKYYSLGRTMATPGS